MGEKTQNESISEYDPPSPPVVVVRGHSSIEMMERQLDIDTELGPSSPLNQSYPEESARLKRSTFASKFREISVEHPPTKSPVDYSTKVLGLCCIIPVAGCGLICALLLLCIVNCIPIAMIYFGIHYGAHHFCPASKVALLLLVGGSISLGSGMLETILKMYARYNARKQSETKVHPILPFLCLILRLASFLWFVTACVMIYRAYPDVTFNSSDTEQYCHPVLYTFAFWFVTIGLMLLGICATIVCASCCCLLVAKSK